MYTLIPQKYVKYLTYEYRLRFIVMLLIFLSAALWVGIVSLFPSYIVSVTEETYAVRQANSIKGNATSKTSVALNHQIAGINVLAGSILGAQDTSFFSNLVEDLAKHKVPGISITSFEIVRIPNASSTSAVTVVIRADAATRELFSAFEKSIESDTRVAKVDFPVSNFAQSKNVKFSLVITTI